MLINVDYNGNIHYINIREFENNKLKPDYFDPLHYVIYLLSFGLK